jgi:hypothetical protein
MTIPHSRSLDDEHEISYEAEGVRFPDEDEVLVFRAPGEQWTKKAIADDE